jgi:hypothetical protein
LAVIANMFIILVFVNDFIAKDALPQFGLFCFYRAPKINIGGVKVYSL